MDAEKWEELVLSLKHEPLKPARPYIPREGLFLQRWQAYATTVDALNGFDELSNFERIFHDASSDIDQRRASVAASFIAFMGCNGGTDFAWSCERFAASDIFQNRREDAFLAAWAIGDKRCNGINHGLRTSEYMLAVQHPIEYKRHGIRGVEWSLVPVISADDRDTLEGMVRWWASADAKTMRDDVGLTYKKIQQDRIENGLPA